MIRYLEIVITALLPALLSVYLFKQDRKGRFDKIPQRIKPIFFGIIFGILAIVGTECGIQVDVAHFHCRDASVMIAGLIFGAPAGLIAGIMGAVERILVAHAGASTFTQMSAILSTLFAGIFSAWISRFVLEKKRPTAGMALFLTISVEVFHLMTIFFTQMDDPTEAIRIIRNCTASMILINSIAVYFAVYLVSIAAGENSFMKFRSRSEIPVFQIIQKGVLTVIAVCLILSCAFVNKLEDNLSKSSVRKNLVNTASNTTKDLTQMVDNQLLGECRLLWKDLQLGEKDPKELAQEYYVSEWFIVDQNGIIRESNIAKTIGSDMSQRPFVSESMNLLNGESQFITEYYLGTNNWISISIATEDGFFQANWNGNGIKKNLSGLLKNYVADSCMGEVGSIIITDGLGERILAASDTFPKDMTKFEYSEFIDASNTTDTDKNTNFFDSNFYIISIEDTEYYCVLQTVSDYCIWALYPVEETNLQREIPVYLAIFLIILACTALYILLYMVMKRVIGDKIVQVADSLSLISSGKLDEVVNVRSSLEFNSLSDDINHTVDTMKDYIAESNARMAAELEAAAQIQLSVLPDSETALPKKEEFEIYAKMDPAKEVGGDFYDFYFTGEDEFNMMIADVSGKGIPAALFMMRAKSILKDSTERGCPVNQVFAEVNNSLCSGNDLDMFVTAWQGKIHLDTGIMDFANAGHNAPLICHADGKFECLSQKRNLVLAAMEGVPYRKNQHQLQPGDIILLYTDGLVEATNAENQLYGEDRLLKIANSQKFTSMKEMVDMIRQDVDRFVGEAPQFDDLTMLAFKYNGKN